MFNNDLTSLVVENAAEIESPALLIYPDRIEENIRRMLKITDGPERLRPHVKTHKMAEVMKIQIDLGITKFKTATIAETEMAAAAGAKDVLFAYQPVGPNVARLLELIHRYPDTKFSAIADDESAIKALDAAAKRASTVIEILLDMDCGQGRSGVEPSAHAARLYRLLASCLKLRPAGLHVYDGHLSMEDPTERAEAVQAAFKPVQEFRQTLLKDGLPVERIVAGGTPTFPMHAARRDVECSPGTCIFWDYQYQTEVPDLQFLYAAVLLTRVVSKPGTGHLCFDIGHKAVASEKPHPRVTLFGLEDVKFVSHSEEHLVAESHRTSDFKVGDVVYGIPRHICPTVALHSEAIVVRNGKADGRWKVTARDRHLTV
jgi:D-threonine aldolase